MAKRISEKEVKLGDGVVIKLLPVSKLEERWSEIAVLCSNARTSFSRVEEVWEDVYRYGSFDLEVFMAEPPPKTTILKAKKVITEFYRW